MKSILLPTLSLLTVLALGSCATEDELRARRKPVGPTTDTDTKPWNTPIGGQGMGQMGLMMQNQHRR